MLPYFPFGSFDLKMGTSPLPSGNSLVEIDEEYNKEVILKRKLLENDQTYYYKSSPLTIVSQWEILEKILTSLAECYSDDFELIRQGSGITWKNKLLNEEVEFVLGENSSLPLEPLDWVGRQVQEDLLVLSRESILLAGQLCFPSGWDIQDKFGKHFLYLHSPVPSLMDPALHSANALIERIPLHKPIARTNWGFRVTDKLDLSSKQRENYLKLLHQVSSEMNSENAGDKIFVRSERQTLSRLTSGFVVFTIHTYNSRLKDEVENADRRNAMLPFVKAIPKDLLEYKLMTPFIRKLIRYLENFPQMRAD